jgi:hypothetical protein
MQVLFHDAVSIGEVAAGGIRHMKCRFAGELISGMPSSEPELPSDKNPIAQ